MGFVHSETQDTRELFYFYRMSISVGQAAPNFTLVSDQNEMVTLTDLKGKPVVLLFFPFAFTGTCTTEMCHMRDHMSSYNDLNATIIGISVDSPFTLAKFKESEGLNFTLLSDFNKTTCQAYGCYYEDFVLGLKGVSKRAVFVLDAEGIVRHAEIVEKAPELPNFSAINETLAAV